MLKRTFQKRAKPTYVNFVVKILLQSVTTTDIMILILRSQTTINGLRANTKDHHNMLHNHNLKHHEKHYHCEARNTHGSTDGCLTIKGITIWMPVEFTDGGRKINTWFRLPTFLKNCVSLHLHFPHIPLVWCLTFCRPHKSLLQTSYLHKSFGSWGN